jgi:hypothetical protein
MNHPESQPQEDINALTQQIVEDARNRDTYGDIDVSGEVSDEVATEFLIRYQNNIISELYFAFNNATTRDLRKPPYNKVSDATLGLWENIKKEALILQGIKTNPAAFIAKYKSQLQKMKESGAAKTPIHLE